MNEDLGCEEFVLFCSKLSSTIDRDIVKTIKVFNAKFVDIFKSDYYENKGSCKAFGLPKLYHEDVILSKLHQYFDYWLQLLVQHKESDDDDGEKYIISHASVIVQFLIILCRSPNNLKVVYNSNICEKLLQACNLVSLHMFCPVAEKVAFIANVSYFLECLYDPHFKGRCSLSKSKESMDKDKNDSFVPSTPVQNNIKVFIIEMLRTMPHGDLDGFHLYRLISSIISVFIAIVHGSLENASRMICPASMDAIFDVLFTTHYDQYPVFCHAISSAILALSSIAPEKRQLEVSLAVDHFWDAILVAKDKEYIHLMGMLIDEMTFTIEQGMREVQCVFVDCHSFRKLYSALEMKPGWNEEVIMAFVRLLASLLKCNLLAQEALEREAGYEKLFAALAKHGGGFSQEVWRHLLCMVVEIPIQDYKTKIEKEQCKHLKIRNAQILSYLLRNLDNIKDDCCQKSTSGIIAVLCLSSWENKIICLQHGIVACVVSLLLNVPKADKVNDDLFMIFESLASISITSDELKMLMLFFESERHSGFHPKFKKKLLRSFIQIASSKANKFQITFWDFSVPNSCLTAGNSFLLSSSGFTLYTWIRFNRAKSYKNNFHLFSMKSANGGKLDVYFDEKCSLCISLAQHNFVVEDVPINDENWHSIGICHSTHRGLFGQNQFNVYVDGIVHLSVAASFPFYSEVITECKMGFSRNCLSYLTKTASLESSVLDIGSTSSRRVSSPQVAPTQGFFRFFKTPIKHQQLEAPQRRVSSKLSQSSGHVPLIGSIKEVMIFNETLSAGQIDALHRAGLDPLQKSCCESEEIASLLARTLLWYNAKASSGSTCFDLSRSSNDGKVVASKCSFGNIKNLLNSVGGIQAFLAMMDQSSLYDHQEVSIYGFGLKEYVDLLFLLVADHPMNLESFAKCDGMAVLGLYLKNVDAGFIDLNLLESLKNFLSLVSTHISLYNQMLDSIFFNFRIWKQASANVLYALLEILKKIAEERKEFCRKNYGVHYLLDVYTVYFSNRESVPNNNYENFFLADIRKSLCTLIKTYTSSGATSEELWEIISAFCHASEAMSSELVHMLVEVFESAHKNNQIYLFMCNVKPVNFLYAFMASDSYSVKFKENIIKVLDHLLKSNKINESYKSMLRIIEGEYCQGFVKLLGNSKVSDLIINWLIEQLFHSDTPITKNIIYIIRLCSSAGSLGLRIKFMQKLIHAMHSKPSLMKNFNEIPGWSHELLQLLIVPKSISSDTNVQKTPSPDLKVLTKEVRASDIPLQSNFDDPYSTMMMPPNTSRQESTSSPTLSIRSSSFETFWQQEPKPLTLSSYCSHLHMSSVDLKLPQFIGDEDDEKEEALIYFILLFICDLAWKNGNGATLDEKSWKIHEDTIVAIEEIQNSRGLVTRDNLAMKFFEILLLLSSKDLIQLPMSSKQNVIKNSLRLLKQLYCFMSANKTNLIFSETLFKNCTRLLEEILTQHSNECQSSFDMFEVTFLLMFIEQDHHREEAIQRLHIVISIRPPLQLYQRACFILANLNKAMQSSNTSEAMISLMETFLDKCYDILNLERELPDVVRPTAGKNTLRVYQFSRRWDDFITKVVEPSSAQEKANMLDSVEKVIADIKSQRFEDLVISMTRRNREGHESESKFKANHMSLLQKIDNEEKMRLKVLEVHDETREAIATIKWKQAKKIFHCERGFWPKKDKKPTILMIAPCENHMRMRPKLMEVELERMEAGKMVGKKEKQRSLLNVFNELKKYGGMKNPVDQLTDEEWEKLKSSISALNEAKGDKKLSEKVTCQECELVTVFDTIQGQLEVTSSFLIFTKSYHNSASSLASLMLPAVDVIKVPLDSLKSIHFRRFNLQRSGLEFFMTNEFSYFFNFSCTNIRNKVYSDIVRLRPPNLVKGVWRSPTDFLKASGVTQKWIQREISNFEYLMQLNTISGRTYNDLSQYPVFPWILTDYTSTSIDLENPNIYRDFSWPVGALNPNNRDLLREKFANLMDSSTDRKDWFHYGTHYSNPAGVMLYLIRLEPFTTLHKQLHGGTFDLTDRQFNGFHSTWNNLMNNSSDVKELIPEFFYLPEFLRNVNSLEMGKMQSSDEVFDDVKLPTWASTPSDFIQKHMDALESNHVSENLNKWIDLIFGYKQRGEEAIEALNVFHYYTYESSLDPNEIPVGSLRKSYEDFVKNFGQTPFQLFTAQHPKRLTTHEWLNQTGRIERVLNFFQCPKISKISSIRVAPINEKLVYAASYENTLLVLTSSGLLGTHTWQNHDRVNANQFTLNFDSTMENYRHQKRLLTSFCLLDKTSYKLFTLIPKTKLLITGGHWDNSLRIYNLTKFKLEAHIICHTDIITCVAADRHGRMLVSGSADGSCIVWDISHKDSKVESLAPCRALCGHSGGISSVALSSDLNVVISSSEDGSIIIYNLDDGSFSKCMRPPRARDWICSVKDMVMSELGYLCIYAVRIHMKSSKPDPDEHMLHVYNINGRHISMTDLESPVTAMLMCERYALIGLKSGEFSIRKLFGIDAEILETFKVPVASICVTDGNGHVIVGLEDSTLRVFQIKTY